MKKIYNVIIIFTVICSCCRLTFAQSVPVGTSVLEDYYRRKQLLGELDPNVSFSIRPIFPASISKVKNVFDPDSTLDKNGNIKLVDPVLFARGRGVIEVLPFSWQQQYNSDHPYGWNDGAMIPARGYQTMVSGGVFLKMGILSIQLRPEFVYAGNKDFDGFSSDRSNAELERYYGFYNQIDEPERFGNGHYTKFFLGQSSVRLTLGAASFGFSNENIWWGPGRRNSIMMTNNAPGFKHFTLNTVKPVKTFIGSFEGQLIAGKLEGSGYTPLIQTISSGGVNLFSPYDPDWRYLTGFNINYQPKWVPGLFLGFTRDFVSYHNDLNGLKSYFPFFTPVQKVNSGLEGDPFARDQRISMYARWLFQKARAEVYFEYGLNDNSYNLRDFAGSPDHARSYIFGISKLLPILNRSGEFIQVNAEIDQLSQSADRLVRGAGGFYQHSGVRQGYTNLGQVLGAGTGSGGNLQSIDVSWVKSMNKLGIALERFEHNADFYDAGIGDLNGQSRRWVDFALAVQGELNYKNLLFTAKIQGIRSLNYQWRMQNYSDSQYYLPHNDVFNLHTELGVSFRF